MFLVPQFHALVEVRTAIALLPLCEWGGNAEDNRERRKELALSLSVDAQRLEADFQAYLRTVTVSRGLSFAPTVFSID